MNNADKPINPVEVSGDSDGNIRGMQTGNYSGWETGLTKREYFAGIALQGLLAANNGQSPQHLVERSVKTADELLKVLEK